jgi:hypothetical protein
VAGLVVQVRDPFAELARVGQRGRQEHLRAHETLSGAGWADFRALAALVVAAHKMASALPLRPSPPRCPAPLLSQPLSARPLTILTS